MISTHIFLLCLCGAIFLVISRFAVKRETVKTCKRVPAKNLLKYLT